jgi:hypothetical protein
MSNIIKKWTTGDYADLRLGEIRNSSILESTSLVMENVETKDIHGNFIEEESAFATTDLTGLGSGNSIGGTITDPSYMYRPVSLALVRRVLPSLFAHNIVGVQPMSTPVGVAFAMRTVYAEQPGAQGQNITPPVDAGWNKVPEYSGYTGGYNSSTASSITYEQLGGPAAAGTQGIAGPADQGQGVSPQTGEGWEITATCRTACNEVWPELRTVFDRKTITAEERRLAASFSIVALQDIRAMHNIDLKAEMINRLQYEVTAELNRELLNAVRVTATNIANDGGSIINVDLALYNDNRQSTAIVVNSIMFASNTVAKKTRRGRANFVVVSPAVASVLQSAVPFFTANTAAVDPGIILSGSETTEIGTLNNAITVYLDQYAPYDYALVGYKGTGTSDSGVIFSPYIMNVLNEAVAQENFQPRIGVMSRYAITTNLLSAGAYYRLLTYTGLQSVTGVNTAGTQGW